MVTQTGEEMIPTTNIVAFIRMYTMNTETDAIKHLINTRGYFVVESDGDFKPGQVLGKACAKKFDEQFEEVSWYIIQETDVEDYLEQYRVCGHSEIAVKLVRIQIQCRRFYRINTD